MNPHFLYCDYIAHTIKKAIEHDACTADGMLAGAGSIKSDLSPQGGWLKSSDKTLTVADRNGQMYEVTIKAV